LIVSRLFLGIGESWVATGATIWGMGRVAVVCTATVISWAGIASYGALAAGAPLGLWIEANFGIAAIGVASLIAAVFGFCWAWNIGGIPVVPGEEAPFGRVLRTVFPYGLGLTLGGIGFGTIATFVTLYFASRNWQNAGLALSLFGVSFVAARLLFVRTINIWGGFRVAIVSLCVECSGLLLLWLGGNTSAALAGAALSGFGFSLVFPALGVEAVRDVPLRSRGSALGVYTAFIDLSIGMSGPIAGFIASAFGYRPIFLFGAAMSLMSAGFLATLWRRQAAAHDHATLLGHVR
jgi:predicted MFS family arabinose efflux permease